MVATSIILLTFCLARPVYSDHGVYIYLYKFLYGTAYKPMITINPKETVYMHHQIFFLCMCGVGEVDDGFQGKRIFIPVRHEGIVFWNKFYFIMYCVF